MALENDPSARMTIKSRGQLMVPGTCMICGSGNYEGNYLDLGVFFDYEGAMAMCELCVVQAGETVGMFTAAEHLELLKRFNDSVVKYELMESELENVRSDLDASNRLLASYITSPSSTDAPASTTVEGEQADSSVSDASVEVSGSGESEAKEPVLSTGRSNTRGSKSGNSSTRKFAD